MSSRKYRALIFCYKHFWRLLALSILLLICFSFHKAFNILPHPVIARGLVIDDHVLSRWHDRRAGGYIIDVVPVIAFEYGTEKYQIIGGNSQEFRKGKHATVIFNKATPQLASELSFMGLLDFPFTYYILLVWFIFSALLYGTTAFDKHFVGISSEIKNLTLPRFILISALLLLIPILPNATILMSGTVTTGEIIDSNIYGGDGAHHSIVGFYSGSRHYEISETDESGEPIGSPVPIIYLKDDPESALRYSPITLYFNNWVAVPAIAMIFMGAIILGGRIKDGAD